MENPKTIKKTSIGGQALIEGVMMRGPQKTALAVRTPEGDITTKLINEKRLKDKLSFAGWPIVRGLINLVESFKLGYKALMMSAELAGLDEEEPKKDKKEKAEKSVTAAVAEQAPEQDEGGFPEKTEQKEDKKGDSVFFTVLMGIASVLGVALAFFLFLWLPSFIFDQLNRLSGEMLTNYRPVFEGVMKIALFIGYLLLVTMMKDIKRLFQYHGAEHKTIFCFESGKELTVENVRGFKRFHPRCGTSFMILMLLVSILISMLILKIFPFLGDFRILWVIIKFIIILPITCSLGYELIRICGRYENILTKIISAPGMWVQRLTTKEPDDSMIEVAITSLQAVIPDNPEDDRW